MPEIKEYIMKDKNWKEMAEYQLKNFFTQDEKTIKEENYSLSMHKSALQEFRK